MNTLVPASEHLEPLMTEALAGRNEEEFIAGYLNGLVAILNKKPKAYRAYGPWWHEIKRMLVERGHGALAGEEYEHTVAQIYSYEREAYTIIAAWLYYQNRVEDGLIYNAGHELPTEDGETYSYYLEDLALECKAM
ncbi:MAG TPA: hypothetical protein VGL07_16815 [Buttiauxella sp.]